MNLEKNKGGVWKIIKSEEDFSLPNNSRSPHFVQSWIYGLLQEQNGYEVHRFLYEDGDGVRQALAQIVIYPLTLGYFFAYLPYGIYKDPTFSEAEDIYASLSKAFSSLSNKKILYLRLESENSDFVFKKDSIFTLVQKKDIRSNHIQPRVEWQISLNENEDALLQNCHKKTRYNISLALKKGIRVEIITDNIESYTNDLLSLMKETASRDQFSMHDESYYRYAISLFNKNKSSFLALAYKGDKLLVASLHAITGDTAFSVWSGSSGEFRQDKATYLLKWKSIVYSKERGLSYYLMGGVCKDNDPIFADWQGLTLFKKGFGGEYVTHGVLFDYVFNKRLYKLFGLLKTIKRMLRKVGLR